jgi:nuclear protein localization family protein 4
MTSYDVRKTAKLQQQYITVHPSGYKVSKFITIIVKPKNENLECELECYMVSDLCQSLERDGLFEDSSEKTKMQVKKKKQKNEVLSTVYMESKDVSQFDPDFCIVNVAHGVPVNKMDMNILKSYDFPVSRRLEGKNITETMVREYFKKHKKDKGLVKYGNFFVLLYFAKCIDINVNN